MGYEYLINLTWWQQQGIALGELLCLTLLLGAGAMTLKGLIDRFIPEQTNEDPDITSTEFPHDR